MAGAEFPCHALQVYKTLTLLIKSIAGSRFRVGKYDFTRKGDLSPELLVVFLVYMAADGNRRGVKHLLADFWSEAEELGLKLPRESPVSAPAICQARQRLDPEVFRDLLYALADGVPQGCGARGEPKWRGRRVYAIDGQKVNLRRSDDLHRHFGTPDNAHCPQALYSVLVDVCARMPVDFELSAYRSSEREHLSRMLDSLQPNDLLILDRGYPSHEVIQDLCEREIDFLIRLPSSNTFAAVDQFRESGATDSAISIPAPENSAEGWKDLELRIVRRETPDGPTFFLTTLSPEHASTEDFTELYRMRWEIEEYFKVFTGQYIGQALFRSTMPSGIRQEFGALTLLYAMSRIIAAQTNERIEEPDAYVSQKAAVLGMGALFMKVSLASDAPAALHFIERAMVRLLRTLDRKRPGRSFPRRSLKPSPKWGPTGRRGG